jgi:hypothetical protein
MANDRAPEAEGEEVTGLEIIEWAVRKCRENKVPPSDNAIVRMIRYHLIDVNDARPKQAINEKLQREAPRETKT